MEEVKLRTSRKHAYLDCGAYIIRVVAEILV
jgi:hypothetical protein